MDAGWLPLGLAGRSLRAIAMENRHPRGGERVEPRLYAPPSSPPHSPVTLNAALPSLSFFIAAVATSTATLSSHQGHDYFASKKGKSGMAWVSAGQGMCRGDLRGLDACAGVGRHRREVLGPMVVWFAVVGRPLGRVINVGRLLSWEERWLCWVGSR
ncbi:hypothetical protein TIFTF001_018762 [Ficus carica]|uniref:Uncharacterized protein n=1 Tax=Ficus carica TaxID=3494 RepID=A0AA88A522_FICCA|nr:hypothetical protein TIFTF001_018762 [Ficus carica]